MELHVKYHVHIDFTKDPTQPFIIRGQPDKIQQAKDALVGTYLVIDLKHHNTNIESNQQPRIQSEKERSYDDTKVEIKVPKAKHSVSFKFI